MSLPWLRSCQQAGNHQISTKDLSSRLFAKLTALRRLPPSSPADRIYGVEHMASLQDQFLKAGLVSQKKVKQANQEKSKQKKDERSPLSEVYDELAAVLNQ